ncbi:MAG: 16S rRNA (cytosine(967)-C(5))-methyltransferase RsmB [Oscillospiraceae bacterium]|nr:16S rRNA (cytosine(967)-C(5))-methyltransferase RsmB [Oscillospiraceae bacterium]
MSARETALCALIACRKGGAWSNGVLKEYCERDNLDRRESALASRLCYGVLQNRAKLDFYLKQLLTGKLRDLHPAVHDILRLGLYQIYEMDRIPDSAAVNESVVLAKKYCPKVRNSGGLVNAVLRNAVRTKGTLKAPESLSDRFSHPENLVMLLKSYVGEDRLEAMLRANNEAAPTVIQVNTKLATSAAVLQSLEADGVSAENHRWLQDCLVLRDTGNMEQLEAFKKGWFYVQDAAARLSVLCAEIPLGAKVLDCCAAPGGKSFAALVAGAGSVISCDVHSHKLNLIKNSANRLGFENITVIDQDGSVFNPTWAEQMDVVIADVPCSGYGIIRKKPDIRYKDPDTMKELPALQLAILCNQARYVRPGGTLMYSTCTLVRRENEGVVEKFLKQNPEFYLEALRLPCVFPENQSGMLALVPGEYDTDGFFICRLRRKV